MFLKMCVRAAYTAFVVAIAMVFSAPPAAAASAANRKPIVWGASIPLTGVFAFAGIQGNAGFADYVAWLNEHGGINGHPVKYVVVDSGYNVKRSLAAFKSITSLYSPPVYAGDSTEFEEAVTKELGTRGNILMGGVSFATALTNTKAHPYQFISGPSYSQQIYILLDYIHGQAKGSKTPTVAFVHSTTAFGRDPIANGVARAKKLGIKVVANIATKPGSIDISAPVQKLAKAKPDYIIFQGYVLQPINEFMVQLRQMGLHTHFMGTFWSSGRLIIRAMGKAADGYMGVVPYNYWNSNAQGPMFAAMRAEDQKRHPGVKYRPQYYIENWFTGMVFTKVIKMTLDAGKPLTAKNMTAALESIKDWNTGGIIGVPVSVKNHSFPVGRVYQVKDGNFVPVSNWIRLDHGHATR